MSLKIRNSVKVLLLNDKDEILLLYAIDPKTTSIDGTSNGNFWFLIGGGIEKNETIQETAIREIYEETGLKKEEITLGPLVWFGEVDLILAGIKTRLKEKFIVAHAKNQGNCMKK